MTYPFQDFDVEKELRPLREKLVLVNGEESPKQPYQVRANLILAEKLGLESSLLRGSNPAHYLDVEEE